MMPLSYAALPESGCPSQAHRRVMHLKNLTTVPDLYYREDRKAENPQPHMPVRQDTDTDNMFEYLDIIYGFLMMSLVTNPSITAMPPSPP